MEKPRPKECFSLAQALSALREARLLEGEASVTGDSTSGRSHGDYYKGLLLIHLRKLALLSITIPSYATVL